MKKILILAVLAFSITNSYAQAGTWTIKLNDKTVLETATEDEKVNIKKIAASDWKKAGCLEINFNEDEPNVWIRSFMLVDEKDNVLYREDSTTQAFISFEKLRSAFKGKKSILI